ncbi:aldo/keto reductase [Leeuwenhoekiella sp. CH_XMU1409-2]|uniref:aldo/keto reductase n=1 Tax=Leeuwenhoekiella sp. CH_XMU1409-2 TaxID=3107768 RepID=UPI0030088186
MIKKIQIGTTNLNVAPINLGGNVFGWTLDEKESFEILDSFVDHGFNFIDTADMYSYWVDGKEGGQSETILGKWMKSRGNREIKSSWRLK